MRRRIFRLPVEEAAIWWVATNYNVSSRQGSRLLGLSPSTIPCLSLPILAWPLPELHKSVLRGQIYYKVDKKYLQDPGADHVWSRGQRGDVAGTQRGSAARAQQQAAESGLPARPPASQGWSSALRK